MKESIKIVEDCLNPSRGEKRGLRKVRPDREEAKKHLKKAEDNLRAMELLYKNKFYDWTVVTAYYAMYHGVLAALRLIGLLALTHKCALNAFRVFFIERGRLEWKFLHYLKRAKKLEEKFAETIERASRQRVVVQYKVVEISDKDVEWILKASREFVEKILGLVVE
jgi:uncharacterized protein (UPF0332 family)